jgi:hypothetical protein
MRTRFVTSAGVLVLAGSLAACGSPRQAGTVRPAGQPQSAPPATSGAPGGASQAAAPPATMTIAQVNTQVLTRYRAYQEAYEQAYATGDPKDLAAVAMDPVLTRVSKDARRTLNKGEIWRFHNVLNPHVQGRSKDNGIVIVIDCIRTLSSYRYSAATGKRLGSWPGGNTYLYQAVMRFTGDTWKISDATQGKKC